MADGAVVDPLDELDAQVARLRVVADELREARGKPVLEGNQVELIEDGPTLLRTYEEMQRSCRVQVRALDRPPYSTPPASQQKLELNRLADGLVYRAIYGFEVFESEEVMAVLPELRAAGEVSRVLPQMPMKMVLGDDTMALVALTKRAPAESHLLIRSSGLLDGLIAMVGTGRTDAGAGGQRRRGGAAGAGPRHPDAAGRRSHRRHDQQAAADQSPDDPAPGPRADGCPRRADPVPGGRPGRPPPLDLGPS
ncbi:hypothetical protein [Kribbella sp. VKM Ac-2571]|uniref:hypothetical protein n=1 Tax=Kribbella sp. VKM Ac-2571 TaxID=2512222 RepID=UPI00105C5C91|nr:hypothetical protein [Kribbella sp. VKM Ac-2571]